MWRLRLVSLVLALLLIPCLTLSRDDPGSKDNIPTRSSYLLQTSVMGSAGAPGASTSFATNGTLGQPTPIGVGSSAGKMLHAGFWGKFWWPTSVADPLPPELLSNMVLQNFPNPFNPSTTIAYTVAEESPVEITVFNVGGEKVTTLTNETKSAGRYNVFWDGRDESGREVSSGVYFYRLSIGDYRSTKKMLMLK